MPHSPKPFYRPKRDLWYVQLNGKQINLGRDKDKAFRRYHKLLAESPDEQPQVVHGDGVSVAVLCDTFLGWVEKHRAPATYGWYQPRLQSFVSMYPQLSSSELKPFHVQQLLMRHETNTELWGFCP